MNEVIEYIKKLMNDSFEGWSEEEVNAYLTACISIKEKIEKGDRK